MTGTTTVPAPGLRLVETLDLESFRRPMSAIPARVEAAIERGAQTGPVVTLADMAELLDVDGSGDGLEDGVIRNPDGQLVVACLTEMPGVSAAMWDWWFAWHSYTSERYRLWHPRDHVETSIADDRRDLPRLAGIVGSATPHTSTSTSVASGNAWRSGSWSLTAVGLDQTAVDRIGLAVCARTALRRERLAAGWLIHLIEDTSAGCRMHSRFFLGDAASEVPVLAPLVTKLVNRRSVRRPAAPGRGGVGAPPALFGGDEPPRDDPSRVVRAIRADEAGP